ncbi:MAG: HD domain-containing protein [Desulfuromonadaceae bacterium]|nr:HD domain-containing protein [Desulfuromonadaceae bacterium]MDD2853985.1 HD domain-containing protein [Desulfuromonadaceae bacterium]
MIDYYRPVAVECLLVGQFPPIALYLRRGHRNFILYKPDDVELTEKDLQRFSSNNVEFVYVRAGDAEIVANFLEDQIRQIFERDDVTSETKELILSVVTFNYLSEVFKTPERIEDVKRCKKLLKALMKNIVSKECLMQALAKVLDGNYQIFAHSIDVTILSMLAHESILNLASDEVLEVGVGAMFHDVGIIYLTSNSLDGPYPCTDIDYSRVKLHPQMGYNLLLTLWGEKYQVALDIVRYHHEKFNGTGYPFGLGGESTPRSAQIVSICDVYSSLTTERPFRKASSPRHSLEIMESEANIFNKEYLQAFKAMILEGGRIS